MSAGMSTTDDTAAPPPSSAPHRPTLLSAGIDILVALVWFAVAGVLGGWLWSVLTPLPEITKTGNTATVPSEQLVKQVGMDGWFFVIALVGGLISGIVLVWWRRRDPLLMVVLVTAGAGLASWLMLRAGRWFGPGDAIAALRRMPDGSHVPEPLRLHAAGVAWVWPIAAAFGALLFLWVLAKPDETAP